MLKDIQSHVDNAGVRAIMKALKTHCPPFKDYDGKFLRSCDGKFLCSCVQKDLQICIFTFKTMATFTECHTNKKYHASGYTWTPTCITANCDEVALSKLIPSVIPPSLTILYHVFPTTQSCFY